MSEEQSECVRILEPLTPSSATWQINYNIYILHAKKYTQNNTKYMYHVIYPIEEYNALRLNSSLMSVKLTLKEICLNYSLS
jgi:hypothetical protein